MTVAMNVIQINMLPIPCPGKVCLCGDLSFWGRSYSHAVHRRDGAEDASAEGVSFPYMGDHSKGGTAIRPHAQGHRCFCPLTEALDAKALKHGHTLSKGGC